MYRNTIRAAGRKNDIIEEQIAYERGSRISQAGRRVELNGMTGFL